MFLGTTRWLVTVTSSLIRCEELFQPHGLAMTLFHWALLKVSYVFRHFLTSANDGLTCKGGRRSRQGALLAPQAA